MENPFKWRHFQPEIILLCVRRYLRYALSYRDLEEMMTERGLYWFGNIDTSNVRLTSYPKFTMQVNIKALA
jgi:transposase-like protein